MRNEPTSTTAPKLGAPKDKDKPSADQPKLTLTRTDHQQPPLSDEIRASCISKSLVPALSMDVWLAFDLKNLA